MPYTSARYQWGHGLGSVFKELFRSALPCSRAPCCGRRAPNWLRAQRKDHEAGPQEPHGPIGRWPHAYGRCIAGQERHRSSQAVGQQEASACAGVDPERPSPWKACRMLLPAYTQQPCVPCTKSELDLESMPPLQIGVIDDYLERTGPKSGLESCGPLGFLIPTSGND